MTSTIILFFILGMVIGSFLNVVISRYNTKRTLGGRSACMSCASKLNWYELIPIFSFLFLRGRCKTCSTKISLQYPVVEGLTGMVFVGIFLKFQDLFFFNPTVFIYSFIFYAICFSLLIVIAVYDLKHKIIPDSLALTLAVITFIGLFLFSDLGFGIHMPTFYDFLAGLIVSLPFALLWIISQGGWMGLGDAKLAVGLGWLLGAPGVLSGTVLAFWAGAVIGVSLIVFSKKHGIKSEIPFAPFLVLGAMLAFIFELHVFHFN